MIKESLGLSLAKLILTVSFIIGGGAWLGTVAYSLAHPEFAVNFGQIINPTPVEKTVNKIEISADKKSILNAETKAVIFTIANTQKYLKDSGYFYNPDTFQATNAKYEGDCFVAAALSNNKDRIVFSTGCLPGDLPQAWIGIRNLIQYECPAGAMCKPNPPKIQFFIAGSGKNFVWSSNDKTITYEADLGLSGMAETRTIDSQTGKILEKKSAVIDISDWKTYTNEKYGFEFKYPKSWIISSTNPAGSPQMISIQSGKQNGSFVLTINEVLQNISLQQIIKEKIGAKGSKNEEGKIKIGNSDGIWTSSRECVGTGCLSFDWFFIKDSYLYHFEQSFPDIYYDKNFDQILSTFKFIEPEN